MLLCCSLISFQSSASSWESNLVWKLRRDRDGIQVYTAKVPGSKYKAVFATVRVKSDINTMLGLMLDLPRCSRWISMCKQVRIEKQLSDTESLMYSYNDVPFPASDRDVYSKVTWSMDESGSITMQSIAMDTEKPKVRRAVRVTDAISKWRFIPEGDEYTLVENYVHADPNGAVPGWLANMLIVNAPFNTLKKMRTLLESGEYDDAEVDWLMNALNRNSFTQ